MRLLGRYIVAVEIVCEEIRIPFSGTTDAVVGNAGGAEVDVVE
jgi:hypothetical protein